MEKKKVIQVQNLTKMYKLYDRHKDRLKDALGLTKKKLYKEKYALKDVNFDIHEGECVGIIGTNGSGKSTILKIITGVLTPTDGKVVVDGRISALLELGAGFNMEYTGLENIYLNGTMIGFTEEEIDARLQDILDFADIGDYIHQPVKMYSSGMFVRLAFAVAINIDPEILIVDEALSVGDVFFQAKCYHKFEEFKQMGRTILFVSHDLGSISKYCDRVILLNQGVMEGEGSPKEIINMYKQYLVHQNPVKAGGEDPNKIRRIKGGRVIQPGTLEYGEKRAEIVDFCIEDENGKETNVIEKGTTFTMKVRVHFNETIQEPIVTYTFKNVQGTDITGSNTMYEKIRIPNSEEGAECIVSFTQEMNLQGGSYLLSFSCTGYRNGDFTAYHRLYDCCSLQVVSSKNTVGFYDMNSRVDVEDVTGQEIQKGNV